MLLISTYRAIKERGLGFCLEALGAAQSSVGSHGAVCKPGWFPFAFGSQANGATSVLLWVVLLCLMSSQYSGSLAGFSVNNFQ